VTSHISQSQITQSHNTNKVIKDSEISNIVIRRECGQTLTRIRVSQT